MRQLDPLPFAEEEDRMLSHDVAPPRRAQAELPRLPLTTHARKGQRGDRARLPTPRCRALRKRERRPARGVDFLRVVQLEDLQIPVDGPSGFSDEAVEQGQPQAEVLRDEQRGGLSVRLDEPPGHR